VTQAFGKSAFETVDRLEGIDDASYTTAGRALLPNFGFDDYSLPDFSMYGSYKRTLPPPQVSELH
jgi:hypothetical protein